MELGLLHRATSLTTEGLHDGFAGSVSFPTLDFANQVSVKHSVLAVRNTSAHSRRSELLSHNLTTPTTV